MLKSVSLADRYDLREEKVLLSGSQALVRATLIQAKRDKKENVDTAGFVSGYRGSPLGAVDQQFNLAKKVLGDSNIIFKEGLNEDIAATSIWGTQQVNLRGDGRTDGVFALWYGKGPGVDRSGDVLRHANLAGTSPHGGVILAMGDDHTGESSTTLHQSEFALMDASIPILSPAGVQEIIDYSIVGWSLSRFASVWVGIKCVKDTVEVTEVVDGSPNRVKLTFPNIDDSDKIHISSKDTPVLQEEKLHALKLPAVHKFSKINNIDRIDFKKSSSKIGIVSAGKSWLDTLQALELLGIDRDFALKIGLSTYKIGLVWPVEPENLKDWASGLNLIIVVEEKRKLIEGQIKQILFNEDSRPTVIGGFDEFGKEILRSHYSLDPLIIALALGERISSETGNKKIQAKVLSLKELMTNPSNSPVSSKLPYFCAGCPHNRSTVLPEGSRAYAGIGCHYMVQWMDRETEGFTHMGGEGANWIGEAPFSLRNHIFQNIGDGTYNHSGLMSIRAAVASGVNMTYKIKLF